MNTNIKTVIYIILGLMFLVFALRAMSWSDKGMYKQGNSEELLNFSPTK